MDFIRKAEHSEARGSQRVVGFDAGLRAYMLKIYNYMALALGVTGIVALFTASSPVMMGLLYQNGHMSGLGWIVAFSPLAFILVLNFKFQTMSLQSLHTIFWAFAVCMGLSLSSLFLAYTGASIARVFFITASVFGGMSLYGYTTRKDLTSMGSFLIMGLFGVIIASLVNIFLHSPGLMFVTSLLSVVIFTGLIAYNTQKLKETYYYIGGNGEEAIGKAAIIGALSLYLDFINLMVSLLDRKSVV